MVCNGNSEEICGGPNRLSLFAWLSSSSSLSAAVSGADLMSYLTLSSGWNYLGCYTDSSLTRTLSYRTEVTGGSQNMTQENCQTGCQASGYTLAGTEYSGECCNLLDLYFNLKDILTINSL